MEFSTYLTAGLSAATETLIRNYKGERTAGSLAEMEQAVQSALHQVGARKSIESHTNLVNWTY